LKLSEDSFAESKILDGLNFLICAVQFDATFDISELKTTVKQIFSGIYPVPSFRGIPDENAHVAWELFAWLTTLCDMDKEMLKIIKVSSGARRYANWNKSCQLLDFVETKHEFIPQTEVMVGRFLKKCWDHP